MRALSTSHIIDDRVANGRAPGTGTRDGAAESPRLEMLRPIKCQLTSRDYVLLEGHLLKLLAGQDPADGLLLRLIRTKLADTGIVLSNDIAPDVATGDSRLVYSIDGDTGKTGVLRHWAHEHDGPDAVPVLSRLGITMLGMKANQQVPLLREDGSLGQVALIKVAFQPEAARQTPRGDGESSPE